MERYHILKLGLAITFYAAYCIRPMLVHSLEPDNDLDNPNLSKRGFDYFQYFQGVEGRPGLDYPVYSYIPRTTFNCKGIESGYYADLDTDCQVFHICEEGKKISFLCPNGTIFQQSELICEWWNKVNCTNSPNLYEESAERLQNDVARRKSSRRVISSNGGETNHGAVMRMEERSSVRATKNGRDYPVRQDQQRQQRIKNHRIPDNNDIEQQIEQAESNNRHLANVQNNIATSQRNGFGNQQHSNHNYNGVGANNEGSRSRSKQTKKDVDKNTGNYINNNYDESVPRQSKKLNQGVRNNFSFGTKTGNQEKTNTLKEYHVQFDSTGSGISSADDYQPTTQRTNKFSSIRQNEYTFATEPIFSANNYQTDLNNVELGLSTSTKISQTVNNNVVATSTTSPPSTNNSTTATPARQRTTKKPLYGIGLKNRYSSFDARRPENLESNNAKSNYRGSVKYGVNSNQPKSTPITTYSPPTRYSAIKTPKDNKSEFTRPSNVPGQIEVNVIQPQNPANSNTNNWESQESQIIQESSSFVKNSFNSITDDSFKTSASPYPNHRSTYSDVKDVSYLEAPKVSSISSITPHLVTTQPINTGKPFVGSRVGSTILPNQPITQSKYTYLPTSTKPTIIFGVIRHTSTTEPAPYGPPEPINTETTSKNIPDLFNVGFTDKTLPSVETSSPATNAVPTEIFNVGKTDSTIQTNVVSGPESTTTPPLNIYVPEQGSLNVGLADDLEPVNEPPFIKKTVPLLYSGQDSTQRTIDHATIYGTYPSSTQRAFASTTNTPYSPTVPTVTQSLSGGGFTASTTPRTSKSFNQGVPIKFDKGQDKISIHLSKNVGGQTKELPKYGSAVQPPLLRVGAVVHVGDVQPLGDSGAQSQPDGFYVTRSFNSKSKTEKPRPFSKSLDLEERFNTGGQPNIASTFPTYQISSARPFGVTETTVPTPTVTTQAAPSPNVYDNVDSMIGVLQEIASFNSQKEEDSRPGLVIPPSVSPQTLHSLAQYFATELQNNETNGNALKPETKERLTSLLTAMTVHGYNNLFNVGSTSTPTAATSVSGTETTTSLTPTRFGNEESKNEEINDKNTEEDNATGDDGELLSTTALPELRQLARNFSVALSSYLNDPDNFRRSLEGLRPTEPPPLEGNENAESSTSEDELLNFSDADVKPSTPAVPSPTWGYILALDGSKGNQEEVKNSLNPDLHTADSQSFVPRYNNVQVDEKQGKGFTDLPPNHWTSSPRATSLWQKALSVNPAIVNDHFETTPSSIALGEGETTEPELFNAEVLPELTEPQSEVTYDLRELPPIALNSTQVHGILIDFMNHTKFNEHSRLNRILKKLNTSEEEFLNRMKEIESNPLTKRLILLLISECGANIGQGLETPTENQDGPPEYLAASASTPTATSSNIQSRTLENHSLGQLIHPHLSEDEQDTRALQLLNSLYTIASKFGKRR